MRNYNQIKYLFTFWMGLKIVWRFKMVLFDFRTGKRNGNWIWHLLWMLNISLKQWKTCWGYGGIYFFLIFTQKFMKSFSPLLQGVQSEESNIFWPLSKIQATSFPDKLYSIRSPNSTQWAVTLVANRLAIRYRPWR